MGECPQLSKRWIYTRVVDELTVEVQAFTQRIGQHQLLLDSELLFHLFWT